MTPPLRRGCILALGGQLQIAPINCAPFPPKILTLGVHLHPLQLLATPMTCYRVHSINKLKQNSIINKQQCQHNKHNKMYFRVSTEEKPCLRWRCVETAEGIIHLANISNPFARWQHNVSLSVISKG